MQGEVLLLDVNVGRPRAAGQIYRGQVQAVADGMPGIEHTALEGGRLRTGMTPPAGPRGVAGLAGVLPRRLGGDGLIDGSREWLSTGMPLTCMDGFQQVQRRCVEADLGDPA
jgi:hypothetical protein